MMIWVTLRIHGDRHGHKNTLNKEHGCYTNDGQANQS